MILVRDICTQTSVLHLFSFAIYARIRKFITVFPYSRRIPEDGTPVPKHVEISCLSRIVFRETYFIVFYYVLLLVNMFTRIWLRMYQNLPFSLRFYLKPAYISGLFCTFIARHGTLPASSSSQRTGELLVLALPYMCPYSPFR